MSLGVPRRSEARALLHQAAGGSVQALRPRRLEDHALRHAARRIHIEADAHRPFLIVPQGVRRVILSLDQLDQSVAASDGERPRDGLARRAAGREEQADAEERREGHQ